MVVWSGRNQAHGESENPETAGIEIMQGEGCPFVSQVAFTTNAVPSPLRGVTQGHEVCHLMQRRSRASLLVTVHLRLW